LQYVKKEERLTLPSSESLSEKYKSGLIELRKEHEAAPSGLGLARKHSDLMDEVVAAIFKESLKGFGDKIASDLKGIAVIAIGGYGRRELCPFSDIDLMILHHLKNKESVALLSENLFYPLWDLGLQVGHGTRTVKESLRMASSNFELQTAFLESRLVAGDAEILRELQEGLTKQLRSRGGKRFLQNILAENERRHKQYGQAAYLLEPDVKEGEGGLRDIHAMLWASKGLFGSASLEGLVQSGHLTDFDVETARQAQEFILQIRNHLHYATNRKTDRLFFEYQQEISRALGFKDGERIRDIERFMRSFYTHASAIERISRSFWEQLKDEYLSTRSLKNMSAVNISEAGIAVSGGKISLTSPGAVSDHPGSEIKMFKLSLNKDVEIDFSKLGLIREGLKDNPAPFNWTQQMRDDFIDILGAGGTAIPILETMDHLGILARYIPEWNRVRCLPQHDSYHLYTVDMHLFLTVAEIHKMGAGGYDESNPLLSRIYNEIERKDLLLIASLLHDVGKGSGKGHSKRGARIAKEICSRMGLSSKDSKTVGFLVENHLLLPDTAMRRDLNDENVIIDLAATIIREGDLKMLYLLSVADSLATGPKAWDIWKDGLLRELFSKVLHIIRSGEYTSKKSIDRMRKTASAVKAALIGSYDEEKINLFLKQMPHSYLLSQTSEDIVEHFKQMSGGGNGISFNTKCKEGVCELTLVAKDQPGLFCKVSGVLALHGINILGAQVYTRSDGIALDIFKITGYFEQGVSGDRWDKIERDIKRALEGKISLEYRIAEKAGRYRGNSVFKRPAQVEIDNSSSDFYTIVEVHAEDRIGLLYTITRVMLDLNLDIHLAKVSTNVDKVIDVFYVWDIYGQKLSDEEQIGDVKKAILMALG